MAPSDLPEYLPLNCASREYAIPLEVLERAVEDGMITAALLNDQVLVLGADVVVIAAQVLKATPDDELVSLNEAARRLEINSSVVCKWEAYGWLPVIATGSRNAKLVSWERVKALGTLHRRQGRRGSRLIPRDKSIVGGQYDPNTFQC